MALLNRLLNMTIHRQQAQTKVRAAVAIFANMAKSAGLELPEGTPPSQAALMLTMSLGDMDRHLSWLHQEAAVFIQECWESVIEDYRSQLSC